MEPDESSQTPRSRGFAIASVVVAILIALGAGLSVERQRSRSDVVADSTVHASATALAVGAPTPAYSARTLSGADVRVGTPDDSITLLNVWATWCTSCREEMQDLEALHRAYGPRGVRVIAVSLDAGSTALVQRFVQRESLTFAVVHDRTGQLQSLYHIGGVPSSYLIARDGRLLWQLTGGLHGASASARAVIDSALGTRRVAQASSRPNFSSRSE